MVRLRQGVTVDRLSQSMHLTTYLDHMLILETDQQAAALLDEVLSVMMDRFMTKVRLADRDAG